MAQYDQAKRRRGIRKGREKGAWLFVPAAELEAAGLDPAAGPPWYRLWARPRKTGPGTILVQLYDAP